MRVRSIAMNAARRASMWVEPFEPRVLMSAGALDSTFGNDGVITTSIGPTIAYSTAVGVQPNGDLIVARGGDSEKGTVTRLTPTGAVDSTFGAGGSLTVGFAPAHVTVLANGNVLLSGFELEELTPTGAVDTAYGTNGVVAPNGVIGDSTVAPNGTAYVVLNGSTVAKYTAAGQPDTSYGTAGVATLSAGAYGQVSGAVVAVDGQGRVTAGISITRSSSAGTYTYGAVRLSANGSSEDFVTLLDTSTGNTRAYTPEAIALSSDGTAYVAAYGGAAGEVIGAVSATGTMLNSEFPVAVGIGGLAVQPDGKLISVGSAPGEGQPLQVIERFNAAVDGGSSDPTFGSDGVVNLQLGNTYDAAQSVVVTPLGDIVVAGGITNGPVNGYTLVALLGGPGATPPVTTVTQLTGITYGTAGSYANDGNTFAKATDGDPSTYFDGATANGNYVEIDLGSVSPVTAIKFAPRLGWAERMVGGQFQASNTPDFSTGVTTLYTITAAPAVDRLTAVNLSSAANDRYWRYVSPNGSYGNIAEFQLFAGGAVTPTPTVAQLAGTTYGTAGSYGNGGNTVANATDGNLATFFDAPTANGNTVDIDLGVAKTVVDIKYAPRAGWAARMVGGQFQASTTADFSAGVVTAYTVTATPAVGALTTVTPTTTAAYRYWRYLAPNGSYGNIAEFQLFGWATARLAGTTYGTAGSYNGLGNTVAMATDGSLTTFFDAPTSTGGYVAIDLGVATEVSQVAFAPRAGFASRMVGGLFQASNTADFSTGVVNLYAVTSAPVSGSLTTVTLATPATYRYFRYLAPAGSYGNIAEFQLFA